MFRQFFEGEIKEPKPFYIGLPRPASKKHTVTKDGSLVSVNVDDNSIEINNKPAIWVFQDSIEWDTMWSWTDFDSRAGKKIEKMIQYLKQTQG